MLYAIAALLVIIIDQWVKYSVGANVPMESAGEELIKGVVSIVNVQNDGAAFGFLSGGGARIYFIILTGVFTVAVILALATRIVSGRLSRWSLVLMTAGGLSNCIDRVLSGYVQDMFKLEFMNFPVFNVADIFITVFCVFFIIGIIFGKRESDYDDEFDEDDYEEYDDYEEEEEEEPPAPQPKAKPEKSRSRKAKYEDEYEQYKAAKAARRQAEQAAPEQPAPQPRRQSAQPAPASDPFAEWERANSASGAQGYGYGGRQAQQPAYQQPVQQPVYQQPQQPVYQQPAPQPAPEPAYRQPAQPQQPQPVYYPEPAQNAKPAPKPAKEDDMEFSLDDILNEFK